MASYTDPDWTRAALLTIDVQNDFTLIDAPAEIPGTLARLPSMRRLLQGFRQQQRPIVQVVRLYLPDGSNVDLCRRELLEQGARIVLVGTKGAELVAALKPDPAVTLDADLLLAGDLQPIGDREWLLYKPRWGAFYRTPLEEHLHRLEVDTLVVCGCNFPNCPRATIYEASERDFRLVAVPDALSKIDDRGMQELKNIGVNFFNSEEVLEELGL